MTSRKSKSKKRSDTKNDLAKSLKGKTFFIDRSSGKSFTTIFSEFNLKFELHEKHYKQDAPDPEWLAGCGRKKWFVISSDKAIHLNAIERNALFNAGVGAFFFTSGDWSTKKKIEVLRKALPKIAEIVLNEKRPFIARIAKDGSVEVWLNNEGEDVRENRQ